jgi:histidyl-tRNA synthetase
MKISKPRGTKDILPAEIYKWHHIENKIRSITALYNFKEIRTPTFESTELFNRSVGAVTDIVGKEMYSFLDKGGNSITLKPEMTANVIRAYIENNLSNDSQLHKLYYITNMFRYEKPQEGRYREHTQFGAEILGSYDVYSDVEVIMLAKEVYNSLGILDFKVKINTIGKLAERKKYIDILVNYLNEIKRTLSEDSQKRLNTNPLRILDSKNPADRNITNEAPKILDYLTEESRERFYNVLNKLETNNIKYEVDFRLVRGLDYYTDTTFEFVSDKLGSQDAIGGGGRYDGLSETLGGKPTPGIGFGSGIERILIIAEKNKYRFPEEKSPEIYFICLNQDAKEMALKIIYDLRKSNIICDFDLLTRSFKSQMREANKLNCKFVFIIGEEELKNQIGILKNMTDSTQLGVKFENLKDEFIKICGQKK